jgi:nucleoside-specific outer membrane channel protein Tsx
MMSSDENSGWMNKVTLLAFAIVALAWSTNGQADDRILVWTNHSATLLLGNNFELPGDNVTTLTLEHSSAWNWGDMFAFADIQKYHDNPRTRSSWYGEFTPRLSLAKVAGFEPAKTGVLKDLLIAATYERGKNDVESLLLGIGADFRVRGFNYLKLNVYARKDTSRGAGFEDVQLTLTWARPFQIGDSKFLVDGFVDYVVGLGPQVNNVHVVPQIKWDLGAEWSNPGTIYLGSEIDYWRNQFGISDSASLDTHQFAVNLLLKVHF